MLTSRGFSIIEVIIAVAIFIIIALTSFSSIIGSLSISRLAEEEITATNLAEQGIEAATSIRNSGWSNLSVGNYGVVSSSGNWSFSGTSDITGKYTRVVRIEDVYRNGIGDITTTGVLDPTTKRIISTVTWNFTPTRQNQIELYSYLTRWNQAIYGASGNNTSASCLSICLSLNFSQGTCRSASGACNQRGETYTSTGDIYCTGGNNADTCCCR